MSVEPPQIDGVRRSVVEANGVKFHVTEAGPPDGRPVLALHGWPQHHYEWRDLLADPPPGLRIIAPDLPGYGWSGPPPHRWAKEDVATDVLALLDVMGLDRVLLVAHDWGAYVGYLMVLRAGERFDGYLAMNINHPWQRPSTVLPHLHKLAYQLPLAAFGVFVQQRTKFLEKVIFRIGSDLAPEDARLFADRFRDPVCARAGRDTYRTFVTREMPHAARNPETRRATVPIRVLFGVRDSAVALSMVSPETANADDYTLETVDASHFVVDERPDLVRKKLIALAEETAHPRPRNESEPVADRDRDEFGNARNSRPRDALGRPLPHGSQGVTRIPDDLELSPAESLTYAQELLDDGLAFNAHEVLEAAWKNGPDEERGLWQGLAQLAVGITHVQRGNTAGAAAVLARAADHLDEVERPARHGIDVDALITQARAIIDDLGRNNDVDASRLQPRLRTIT